MLKKCQFKDMIHVYLAGRFKHMHETVETKKKGRILGRHVTKKAKKVESTFVQHYELSNFSAILPV